MLRIICYFLLGLYCCSCGKNKTSPGNEAPAINETTVNALKFINGYTANCNKMKDAVDMVAWVKASELATPGFKSALKKIADEAAEPDGIDADPVFDAQDFPDEGFVPETFDPATGYLIVKGKDWPEFRLTMRVKNENGKYLVDGCGIVNIPQDRRIAR